MQNYKILVNTQNLLPEAYVPDNLVPAQDILGETCKISKSDILGNISALLSLKEMFEFSLKKHIKNYLLVSGYRSFSRQSVLYNNSIARNKNRHPLSVQPAGSSEHQTGLAFDIVSVDFNKLETAFATTAHGLWLNKNAYNFGFILRYPKNKEHITGVIYEPWHFRYVGMPAAKEIHLRGICLEELF